MQKQNDKNLIELYLSCCVSRKMNQNQIAKEIGKSRQWASLLVAGDINRPHFQTRNRMKEVLLDWIRKL